MFGKKEDRSVNTKNNSGVIITGDDNTVIHLPPHIIPKALTTQIGLANDIDFVGRKEELQKVDELLNQNATLLLLNGIGGIGKSTLASYYLNQKKDKFDYYGFVQVNDDIKLSLASAFSTSLDLKSEKIDDLFAEIMNKLQNLEGKKLLIIDDVKEMDNQLYEMNTLMTLKNSGFQILFTSRETKEYIPQYFLDIMSVEDARELFLKHYPTDEIDKVDKILEYLDYHTLFIEMTAKMLTNRQKSFSIDELEKKFNKGKFSKIEVKSKKSFSQYLNELFNFEKLEKDEILLLKRLSIYPSIEINFQYLIDFFSGSEQRIHRVQESISKNRLFQKIDDNNYKIKILFFSFPITLNEILNYNGLLTKEKLELSFNELVRKGWLIKSNDKYKLHQIIKEYILENHTPKYKEIHQVFCNTCWNLVDIKSNIESAINNKRHLIYFESIREALIIINTKYIDFVWILEKIFSKSFGLVFNKNRNIINFYNNLSDLYYQLGQYQKALIIEREALELNKKISKKNSLYTAIMFFHLAKIYISMQNYKEALPLSIKILKIYEKNLDEIIPYSSIFFDIYRELNKYDNAEKIIKDILLRYEKKYGEFSIEAMNYYLDLARVFREKEEYNQSLEINIIYLKKQKNLNGKNHFNIITIFNNIGEIYQAKKEFNKAITYHQKCLKILRKNYPNNKLSLGVTYLNLGEAYWHIDGSTNAISLLEKALDIYIDLYEENHPQTLVAFTLLANLYTCKVIGKGDMKYYSKGINLWKKIIEIKKSSLLIDTPSEIEVLENLHKQVHMMEEFYENHDKYDYSDFKIDKDNLEMVSFKMTLKSDKDLNS